MDISEVEKQIAYDVLQNYFFEGFVNPTLPTNWTAPDGTVVPMKIFRRKPDAILLQADMNNGVVDIGIYPVQGATRIERGHQLVWETMSTSPITASATVLGNIVQINGVGTAGNNVGIAYGRTGWQYRPNDGDSAQTIASTLASAIPGAIVSNNVVILQTSVPVSAGVVGDATQVMELDYQSQRFMITIYAPDPSLTDLVGGTVRLAMAEVRALGPGPDGDYSERPIYRGVYDNMVPEKVGVYPQTQCYEVSYGTYKTQVSPGVLFFGINMNTVQTGYFYP